MIPNDPSMIPNDPSTIPNDPSTIPNDPSMIPDDPTYQCSMIPSGVEVRVILSSEVQMGFIQIACTQTRAGGIITTIRRANSPVNQRTHRF